MGNTVSPLPIQKDCKDLELGKLYRLSTPIEVESYRVRSQTEIEKKKRKFLIIKPVQKRGRELICTAHKVKEIEPGKFKNCKERYFFTLPEDLKLLN
ncbi:MAG: hypothetical protein ABH951_01880 [Patescibacteria group bacterium]